MYVSTTNIYWSIFKTKIVEKIATGILRSVTFFRKSYRLLGKVEKYSAAGQATDDKIAHAHFKLGT